MLCELLENICIVGNNNNNNNKLLLEVLLVASCQGLAEKAI